MYLLFDWKSEHLTADRHDNSALSVKFRLIAHEFEMPSKK